MGERKVLNKYLPPDFDPEQLARGIRQIKKRERERKETSNYQIKVRMMLPMSIRCNTCGTYLYKGTKFNSRKEDAGDDESYLGIRVVRLYFRCPRCASELAIKTDPKNSDYVVELGATRNYEPWRARENEKAEAEEEKKKEEEGDAMRQLENKAKESKAENDIMDALDEMVSLNARKEAVMRGDGTGENGVIEAALRGVASEHAEDAGDHERSDMWRRAAAVVDGDVDAEDDEEVRRAFEEQRAELMGVNAGASRRRLNGDDENDDDDDDRFRLMAERDAPGLAPPTSLFAGPPPATGIGGAASAVTIGGAGLSQPRFKVQRKPVAAEPAAPESGDDNDDDDKSKGDIGALGLLGDYGSSDDDDDDER